MSLRTWRRQRRSPGQSDPAAPRAAEAAAPARGAAEASPPAPGPDPARTVDDLLAEADAVALERGSLAAVELLQGASRARRDPAIDSRILALRHAAAAERTATPGRDEWPPRVEDRFAGVVGCPEISVEQLDADVLASAVTHHGCLLVRGLVSPDDSARLVEAIDRSFDAADVFGDPDAVERRSAWYQPFRPGPGYDEPQAGHRGWVRAAGGVLAADSPPAFETMIESFERAGLRDVISGYLGERPVLSVDKCTLRRVPLDLGKGEWHQDGSFLGEGIRSLNVWLALSPCGGDLPTAGLDLVPRRFDSIVPTGTPGAWFDWSVSPLVVEEVSVDAPVIRPVFAAGDALLFDDLFLHRTALPPEVTEERYAIESWFFAASAYPGDAVPIVF